MDAMNSLKPISLLERLVEQYPQLSFVAEQHFVWSPQTQSISYNRSQINSPSFSWRLLHELAHADLGHTSFNSDFELLRLEVSAWERAKQLGVTYVIEIPQDYIEDCLDSYRDWLHKRSTCPTCSAHGVSLKPNHYTCLNCKAEWKVPRSQLCRIQRNVVKAK